VDAIVQPKTAKDCPVSASLTDDDKARLLEIKQNALARILADKLKGLVCAKDATAIQTLHAAMKSGQLAETGAEASGLVDYIMSKDCPVSASLTEDDKAKLRQIKQDAEGTGFEE
jgi:hypothetical protein